MSHVPILSILIVWPLVAAMGLLLVPSRQWARPAALTAAWLEVGLTLAALWQFNSDLGTMQLVERATWMPSLGVQYLVGVDGLSVLFLPACAVLFASVMTVSWVPRDRGAGTYYGMLLALEGLTVGVYTSLDLVLFFLFWELTLIPAFFLISLFGEGSERRYAATKYTLMMLAGGVPLLFGIIAVGLNHAWSTGPPVPAGLSFDYLLLLDQALDARTQLLVLVLLSAGFALKAPLVPFHTWLPTVAFEGPAGLTAALVGLKLGLYGLLRFAIPLAPAAAADVAWVAGLVGAFASIYGGLLALRQTNLRRMLAFASIGHVGLALVGLSALNITGVQGTVLHVLSFATIAGGLMLVAGALQWRVGSTDLASLGGSASTFPRLAAVFLLLGAGSIGLPGTSGFVAEYLMVLAVFESNPGAAAIALAGVVLSAAYFLTYFRDAFMGPSRTKPTTRVRDLQPRESVSLLLMVALTVVVGLFPNLILGTTARAAERWVAGIFN